METRSHKNRGKALCDRDHGDDEENMEKFFELVKNIRGARHYSMNHNSSDEVKLENVEGDKRRKIEEEATWKPTLQPEDFQAYRSSSTSMSQLSAFESNGGMKKDEKKRRSGLGLDLNLPP